MRIVLEFARADPRRSLVTLLCLLLAGLAEGVGVSSVLPLLELAVAPDDAQASSGLARQMGQLLAGVGLRPSLELLLGLLVGAMLAKAVLMLLANREVGYTVARVATELRLALLRALLEARWSYYTRQPVGVVANAFATEAERASQAYLHGTLVMAAALQVAIYIGVAFLVSWQATLAALVVGGASSWLLGFLVRSARRSGERQTALLKTSLTRLSDALQAVKPLRAMAREDSLAPILERETRRLDRALRGEVLSKEGLKALQEPIVVIALAGGFFVALTSFGFPLASLLMLGLLFARTLGAVNKGQKQYQSLAARESAYWSLRETIDRAVREREASDGTAAPVLHRELALRDVALVYADTPVLEAVDLSIPAGQLTALVGPSGAGKTSIADLVLGLVRPTRGEVWIDDVPLCDADLRHWRRQVGYVPQEMFLLHDSVRTNVTLNDPSLGEADVARALRDAGAEKFVERLPQGMHTVVGERGSLLSGGQRQRIAIARALVHRPTLLVLDEATTALDPETEAAVLATVCRLRGEVTILAISHQPALTRAADRVYRIENGGAKRLSG